MTYEQAEARIRELQAEVQRMTRRDNITTDDAEYAIGVYFELASVQSWLEGFMTCEEEG